MTIELVLKDQIKAYLATTNRSYEDLRRCLVKLLWGKLTEMVAENWNLKSEVRVIGTRLLIGGTNVVLR